MNRISDRVARGIRLRRLAFASVLCFASLPAWAAAPAQSGTEHALKNIALKGIVFRSRPEDLVRTGAAMPAAAIDTSGVPRLGDAAAMAIIRPYIGLPISPILLGSLRGAVSKYYARINHPFVSVTIPNQDVTDGVIQIVVIEARLGKVAVTGNHWFDSTQYLDAMHLQPDGPIDGAALQADLDWINRNQYRHAKAAASAGETPGATNLTIETEERVPYSFTAGVDNTGNSSTGLYRVNVGVDWGNAFWRGDDLNYHLTMSPDANQLRQHSLSYTTYLPWRDTLSLSGSLADFNGSSVGSPVTTTGRSEDVSLRYAMSMSAIGDLSQGLTFGFDFKSTNNNILFGGVSVFPTTTEIDQFLLTYDGQVQDPLGSTGFELTLVGSPGGLSALNNDAAFNAQQAGAPAKYAYGRIAVNRLTNLPSGFSWAASGTLQISGSALLPSEQLGFGGPGSNRGFVTYGTTRDEGFQLTNELRAPSFSPGLPELMGLAGETDSFVPYIFVDYGIGRSHTSASGTWLNMISVGPGLNYNFSHYGTVCFSYGIPIQRNGQTGDTLRPQFSVQFTF